MSTSREEMILCKHSHSSESLTNKKYQHCPAVRYNIAMISKSRQFSLKAPSKLHLSKPINIQLHITRVQIVSDREGT